MFHGWKDGFKGANGTKVVLSDITQGNSWDTTSLGSFLRGAENPKSYVNRKLGKTLKVHIDEIKETNAFPESTVFKRVKGRLWEIICPVCKEDDYTTKGGCSYTFEADIGSLKKGHLSCRCSRNHKWTKAERMYQITTICNEVGGSFENYNPIRNLGKERFTFICKEDHRSCTSVDNFFHKRGKCRICADLVRRTGNGYYEGRVLENDTLYIVKFPSGYIKVGRSFRIKQRMKELRRLSKETPEVIGLYTGIHAEVYKFEQDLHKYLKSKMFNENTPDWSTELFSINALEIVIQYIESKSTLTKKV